MKIAKYFWDLSDSALQETEQVLKNPHHPRYNERMMALLARCDKPNELFGLIDKEQFIQSWPGVRAYWSKRARTSVQREWWDALYEQIAKTHAPKQFGSPTQRFRRIGEQLRKKRIETQLSHKQLASLTGLTQSAVSQIEEGKKNVTLLTLLRLCQVLKIKSLEIG